MVNEGVKRGNFFFYFELVYFCPLPEVVQHIRPDCFHRVDAHVAECVQTAAKRCTLLPPDLVRKHFKGILHLWKMSLYLKWVFYVVEM